MLARPQQALDHAGLFEHLRDGGIPPEAFVRINCHQGLRNHAVDVEGSVQVLDFVLQDPRVPTARLNRAGFAAMIQAAYLDRYRSRYDGHESRQTQASFKEGHMRFRKLQCGIDDHMERDSVSPPLGEFSRTQIEVILDRIFDYGESQSQADLWRGEADAGRIAHCLAHELDEVLYLARAYLFKRQIHLYAAAERGYPPARSSMEQAAVLDFLEQPLDCLFLQFDIFRSP